MDKNLKEIIFSGRFRLKAHEQHFREQYFKQNKTFTRIAFTVTILMNLFFLITDFKLFGTKDKFFLLMIIRGTNSFSTLILFILLKKIKSVKIFDLCFNFWLSALCLMTIFIDYTRPVSCYNHFMIDIVFILAIYTMLHVHLELQVMLATLFSVSNILLLLFGKKFNADFTPFPAIISLLCGNIIGISTSWLLKTNLRQSFLLFTKEKALKDALQISLENVKQLKGLLPICYLCHKIRDDQGYWQKLEKYIRAHTEAEFTHWLCPDCYEIVKKNETINR